MNVPISLVFLPSSHFAMNLSMWHDLNMGTASQVRLFAGSAGAAAAALVQVQVTDEERRMQDGKVVQRNESCRGSGGLERDANERARVRE